MCGYPQTHMPLPSTEHKTVPYKTYTKMSMLNFPDYLQTRVQVKFAALTSAEKPLIFVLKTISFVMISENQIFGKLTVMQKVHAVSVLKIK